MDPIRVDDLRSLTEPGAPPCVSVYLETHRFGAETGQDRIRLKNLARDARRQLERSGVAAPSVRSVLRPLREFIEEESAWRGMGDGLAMFLRPGWSRSFRLPFAFPEIVTVGERFDVKPLLPVALAGERFLVLALSQDQVRLLEGTRHGIEEVELEHVPRSLAFALRFDDPQAERLYHVTRSSGTTRAVFHGHGVGGEVDKDRILRFFREVDRGLHEVLHGRGTPMLLACVDYEAAIYREANTYPHLVPGSLSGNPDRLSAEELHRRAWTLMEPMFHEVLETDAARFRELAGTGLTSHDLGDVLDASLAGRVEVLFVAIDRERWGAVDPLGKVEAHGVEMPGDRDLLDVAAVRALASGARVHAISADEMPSEEPAAAILRF